MKPRRIAWLVGLALLGRVASAAGPGDEPARARAGFRAGASSVDVSPVKFPVLINGGFFQAQTDRVRDPLFARCLVLDDNRTRLAIVVVDSCMMPRDLLDRAKALARERTGIPTERMLISATHTHTAPAAMGALGCSPDASYIETLPDRIAESIAKAVANLEPAQAGWASVDDAEHTHCRRWIRKPDRLVVDPFGQPTGRAHMHPGYQNPDAIGPSGPVDPQLSVLAIRATSGRPLAVLANYSMHYFGATPASADYFGQFAARLGPLIGVKNDGSAPPFVAMMSQGTSGDQQWMDYGAPKSDLTLDRYAEAVTRSALNAHKKVEFRDDLPLDMAETTLTLHRRVPDPARLDWARPIVAAMGDRPPKSIPEVYAREAIFLHEQPVRELKLQAIRLGDLGITAIPNEVYALTGLKIKARSPLPATFNIELANGSEGYIPPPEQHALGGYTTWPARTAALEVAAESRITETVLGLLEKVASRGRRVESVPPNPYADAILASKPWAYWRLEEMDGRVARDSSGNGRHAAIEDGAALFLEGAPLPLATGKPAPNRSIHLAGGRLRLDPTADLAPASALTVAFWFWNGLPADARAITGTLAAIDGLPISLGIGGTKSTPGRLFLEAGDMGATGTIVLGAKSWHHVAIVRTPAQVVVYLDGRRELGIETTRAATGPRMLGLSVGGSAEPATRFEGKIDDVAVFDRALTESEVARHFAAASGR